MAVLLTRAQESFLALFRTAKTLLQRLRCFSPVKTCLRIPITQVFAFLIYCGVYILRPHSTDNFFNYVLVSWKTLRIPSSQWIGLHYSRIKAAKIGFHFSFRYRVNYCRRRVSAERKLKKNKTE